MSDASPRHATSATSSGRCDMTTRAPWSPVAGRRGHTDRAEAHRVAAAPVVGGDRDRRAAFAGDGAPRLGRHERLVAQPDHDGVVTPARAASTAACSEVAWPSAQRSLSTHARRTSRHRSTTAVRSTAPVTTMVSSRPGPDRVPQRPRRQRPPAEVAEELVRVAVEAAARARSQYDGGDRHPGRVPDQSTSCTTCGRDRPFSVTSRPGLKQNSPELSVSSFSSDETRI